MKPAHWLLAGLAVAFVVLTGLSWRPAEASSGDMATLTKKKAPVKPAGKPAARRAIKQPARTAREIEPIEYLPPDSLKLSAWEVGLMEKSGPDIGPMDA